MFNKKVVMQVWFWKKQVKEYFGEIVVFKLLVLTQNHLTVFIKTLLVLFKNVVSSKSLRGLEIWKKKSQTYLQKYKKWGTREP